MSVVRESHDGRLLFRESLIPSVNSVDIHGPKRALLVLMDETSQHNSSVFEDDHHVVAGSGVGGHGQYG